MLKSGESETQQIRCVDDEITEIHNLVEAPWDTREEITKVYDDDFFNIPRAHTPQDTRSTKVMLNDARIGLELFLNEAMVVLLTCDDELTNFQKEHLQKITSFIEALKDRFDKTVIK